MPFLQHTFVIKHESSIVPGKIKPFYSGERTVINFIYGSGYIYPVQTIQTAVSINRGFTVREDDKSITG